MSKTTNKFSPEVRERAVRLVLDNEGQQGSRWQSIMSISAKVGCTPQTLNEWVKKAEVDSGKRAGIPTNMAEKMKALEEKTGTLAMVARTSDATMARSSMHWSRPCMTAGPPRAGAPQEDR